MLRKDTKDYYFWPVCGHILSGDEKVPFEFDAKFKRLPAERTEATPKDLPTIGELQAKIRAAHITGVPVTFEVLRIVWIGWREGQIEVSAGVDMPYSEEAREDLFGLHPVPTCVLNAWGESNTDGIAKNSKAPRAG